MLYVQTGYYDNHPVFENDEGMAIIFVDKKKLTRFNNIGSIDIEQIEVLKSQGVCVFEVVKSPEGVYQLPLTETLIERTGDMEITQRNTFDNTNVDKTRRYLLSKVNDDIKTIEDCIRTIKRQLDLCTKDNFEYIQQRFPFYSIMDMNMHVIGLLQHRAAMAILADIHSTEQDIENITVEYK